MKTFKLMALQLSHGKETKEILLEDGLIINMEEDNKTWLIEVYTSKSYLDYFEQARKQDRQLGAEAVITRMDNTPVSFNASTKSIKIIDDHISVLLEGKPKNNKQTNSEQILEELIKQGLSGEDLLKEFKKRKGHKK